NQRRPLPANGHVRWTKIRNDRHSHSRREDGTFSDLPSGRDFASKKIPCSPLVIEGLPVTSNQLGLRAEPSLSCEDSVRIQLTKEHVQAGEVGDAGLARIHG